MIFKGVVVAFIVALSHAAAQSNQEDETPPLLISSLGNQKSDSDPELPPLLGRPVDPLDDTALGYVYPKPAIQLSLPPFTTLDAKLPLDGAVAFGPESTGEELERSPRSPQRRRPRQRPRPQTFPNFPGMFPGGSGRYPGMFPGGSGRYPGMFPGSGRFPGMYPGSGGYIGSGRYPGMFGSGYPGIRPLPALYGNGRPMSLLIN